jgi:hypothetical protein
MFVPVNDEDKRQLSDLSGSGFQFDWTIKSSPKTQTVAKIVDGDIAGLVEFERQPENLCNYLWLIELADSYKGTGVAGKLLADVGRDSLEAGFEGFVVFETKTALYNYYQEKYGAKPIGGRRLLFDKEATENLIAEYLGDAKDEK